MKCRAIECAVHLDLLAEAVGQAGEPAHVHPHGEVLPLDVAGADVLRVRVAGDRLGDGAEADGRAVPPLALGSDP